MREGLEDSNNRGPAVRAVQLLLVAFVVNAEDAGRTVGVAACDCHSEDLWLHQADATLIVI